MKKERNHQKELDPKVRAKCFDEVTHAFSLDMAASEADRCLNCKNAPCKAGCPVGVRIPEFITAIKSRDVKAAIDIIKSTNSLPAVCGRVCPQETQCEARCVRAKMEGPVAIGALERFTADYARENALESLAKKGTLKGKVAVVGSGPAGLTVAAETAMAGLDVTIFEAFHQAGGVLVYGIPEFRLPKKIVADEIKKLTDLGVKIELNTVVGKTITIEQLQSEFDAIFIGSGAGLPQFLGIPGENLNGVLSANEYLTRVNLMKAYLPESETPVRKGKNVVVFGAGNVAMDASRTALRLGADKVSIVYRRGREEMPAREEEIVHAVEEGVELILLTAPVEILGENGIVSGVKCIKCELGEPDASGRRSPVPIACSEFVLPCDMAIIAVGTSPNPLIKKSMPDLATSKKGTLVVDENLMTNVDGVFAGGDAVTGAATVILAMGAGRQAAKAIIERLRAKTEGTV